MNLQAVFDHSGKCADPNALCAALSVDGMAAAQAAGWRTFRVASTLNTQPNEIVCANTTRGITCAQCKLCAGTAKQAQSIVIQAHGAGKRNLQ
jgi:hypothetical protein